jgi:cell division transport system permease protein
MAFILKETFRAIRKAKLYFLLSAVTMFVSVFLIQASLVSNNVVTQTRKHLSDALTMQVYLDDSISADGIALLKSKLTGQKYVSDVRFLSKAQAESLFVKETGEDFKKILAYNPLPASFVLKMDDAIINGSQINALIENIKKMPNVVDVSFETDTFKIVMSYFKQARMYIFILTIILTLIAIYISFSMAIVLWHLRTEEVKIMRLVGSSTFSIKLPILLNGIIVGITGAVLSLLAWVLLCRAAIANFGAVPDVFGNITQIMVLTFGLGPVIGLISSGLAVARIKK